MDGYIYKADTYCEDCGIAIMHSRVSSDDSTEYPQPVDFSFQESDTPSHCGKCGVFLENPITQDGVTYVTDAIADYLVWGNGNTWHEVWENTEVTSFRGGGRVD